MLSLHTEEITCPRCAAKIDVPVYQHNDIIKYGMKFCHQCGESLFVEPDSTTFISKDFLYWLGDHFFQSFCDSQECKSCLFSINQNGFSMQCTKLSDEQMLQICKRIYDKE